MIEKEQVVSPYLSRPPYFPAQHRVDITHKVSVFADMVDVQGLNPPKREFVPSTKQKLKGLSDKARHSMIEFLAKIIEVPDFFVTMTYSDDVAYQAYLKMHGHFEIFRKRLERRYPNIRAMWRIEFVTRKSGVLTGTLIPHFHLLIWLPESMTEYEKECLLAGEGQQWRNWWHEITHSSDMHHKAKYGVKVEAIKSRRHAYAYCSKYLAKDTFENVEAGRRWGRIGKFEQPTEAEALLTGREYIHFKRLLNAYIKSKAPKFYKSFRRMNVHTGCSVFGLGFISQEAPIGNRTIYRMLRHARELARQEQAP